MGDAAEVIVTTKTELRALVREAVRAVSRGDGSVLVTPKRAGGVAR